MPDCITRDEAVTFCQKMVDLAEERKAFLLARGIDHIVDDVAWRAYKDDMLAAGSIKPIGADDIGVDDSISHARERMKSMEIIWRRAHEHLAKALGPTH